MTADTNTAFSSADLFNCCLFNQPPDWGSFTGLDLGGCIRTIFKCSGEIFTQGVFDRRDAEFFTIYGRLRGGGCEPITYCLTFTEAEKIASELCNISGLPLTVCC